jgi:hypothetical protein
MAVLITRPESIITFLSSDCWPEELKSSGGDATFQPLDWLNAAFPHHHIPLFDNWASFTRWAVIPSPNFPLLHLSLGLLVTEMINRASNEEVKKELKTVTGLKA